MDIIKGRLEDVKRYDPTRQIIIIWDIDDIKGVRPDLTDEQANNVLQGLKHKHSANVEITPLTILSVAEMLYPEKPIRIGNCD